MIIDQSFEDLVKDAEQEDGYSIGFEGLGIATTSAFLQTSSNFELAQAGRKEAT